MLETRQIRTFDQVARSGSFSEAARVMGYTQPAISQQMRALEHSVGTALFTRNGRTLGLTEAGELLAKHAQDILAGLDAAQQQVAALRHLAEGRVRVCAFPSASATLVASATARLRSTNPGVDVELMEAEPPESLNLLQAGRCDIALAFNYTDTHTPEQDLNLAVTPLLDDEMQVVMPSSHPLARRQSVALADLAEETWIAGCKRCRATFVQACDRAGFEPQIACTTDDNLAVQSHVVAGVGIAVMPALVLSFLCHPRLVGRPMRPGVHRTVAAYTLPVYTQVPATAAMLDALAQVAAQRPRTRRPTKGISRS